ncbi:MAG: CoA pyrophosphatase [Spirochaetes bacterium]|jgi:8-oxo-dGTP pyrophosphatase MutT (NUDIX family)|nr:CoA pyrophosphatase [Spirochaetota bacterium]
MDLKFRTDEDFLIFKDTLRQRLLSRGIKRIDAPDFIPSAVMMLLMNKDGELHVFLTKRTDGVATHKGDVSFPGGSIDEGDKDAMDAAFRETHEEAGISSDKIEIIGQFDEYYSVTGFHVSTFIGVIEYPYKYKLNSAEIETCFDAPMSMFCNREFDRIEKFEFYNQEMEVYYYSCRGFTIWGMTARILTDFAEKVLRER